MKSPLRILHLEDELPDAELVKAALDREGLVCNIFRVETPDAFMTALEQCRFDIILADYSLPGFDGVSALAIVKERCPGIPFIFISGRMGEEVAIETLKNGATDYVMKDSLSKVAPSVRRALEEATEKLERRKAVEELKRSNEQLRNLAAHLQSVREEERMKIAREIHDELGQALTAQKMELNWFRESYGDNKPIFEKAGAMLDALSATIRSVKRICTELRPSILDDFGIVDAMQWQANEFHARTRIECIVDSAPEDIKLDKERSTALFRIFQEALTNVLKHAKATKVTTRLTDDDDSITLEVIDNGKGITDDQLSKPQAFGLLGMRERVYPWGGRVEVTGYKNKGTTVKVRIPHLGYTKK